MHQYAQEIPKKRVYFMACYNIQNYSIKGKDMDPSSLLNWACENQCKSSASYFSSYHQNQT
jgi:hypothetical protein